MRLATLPGGAALVQGATAARIDGYADAGAVLAAGPAGLEAARAAERDGRFEPYAESDLKSPVPNPGAVFCVGLNYRNHILEMGRDLPQHPTLFAKLQRTLTDPFAEIELPDASPNVDYEGELVIVIGRGGRDIDPERATEHIGGYTLMNDVSMRDWQNRTLQWFAGKNFERSTPVGPWVATPDEVDLTTAGIRVTVNGETRQESPLADLVFDPVALVADVSRITTLEPGDLIATGTPGGVGHAMKPPSYLADGDVVEIEIDGIGAIRNRFTRR
jgi:acylpyruvate hydrolase